MNLKQPANAAQLPHVIPSRKIKLIKIFACFCQNLCYFSFLTLSSRVKNNTGFAQVETSFSLISRSKEITKTVSFLAN